MFWIAIKLGLKVCFGKLSCFDMKFLNLDQHFQCTMVFMDKFSKTYFWCKRTTLFCYIMMLVSSVMQNRSWGGAMMCHFASKSKRSIHIFVVVKEISDLWFQFRLFKFFKLTIIGFDGNDMSLNLLFLHGNLKYL